MKVLLVTGVLGLLLLIKWKSQSTSTSNQTCQCPTSPWVIYAFYNSLSLVLLLCHLIPEIKPIHTSYNTHDSSKQQHISINTGNGK
ncbi:p9 movement protein [Turnip crinkle virus]|uniref:Double gene block protein 2 n=1 Tax=Turnip crinkle virus TaxID=11988 RepID=MP2_TCV|nr:p9 movement protein [Turnip crinkle virus]Q7TD19.2 RecName: Full=Double gene block protein 2; Short=DGBp2; AltName: Full=Movement protein P9 [Turnip crinkle virus]AHZ65050.1 p9 movement protein [Turnip crinkle virus]